MQVPGEKQPVGVPPRVSGLGAIFSAARFMADPIGTTQRLYDRFGPVAELNFPLGSDTGGALSFVFGIGPKYNERVLGDPATFRTSGIMMQGPKGSAQRRIRDGIVGMNGPKHVHYRKMLLPPLRRPIVDAMVSRMAEVALRNVEGWPRGQIVDLWPLVKRMAQDITISMLFVAEGDGDHAEAHHAADMINEHMRLNGLASVKACPVDIPGLPFHGMMRSAERLEAYLGPWALKRRGDTRRDDLLSIIVNSPDEEGKPATDSAIAGQILTLFGAAYETCETALLWALFLLAQHPEAATKLLDEIDGLPDDGTMLAPELNSATWLDAVVRESMRLMPPVPMQMRVATRDTELGDYSIANKTRVVLSPYLTNRMPGLYPEANKFKPERWNGLDPNQYEYVVFSGGPRFCPGAWFGTTMVKVALVHIMRQLRVEVVKGARIDRQATITLAPKGTVPVVLRGQDRQFAPSSVTGDIHELVALEA
jgi:cytochrome P450